MAQVNLQKAVQEALNEYSGEVTQVIADTVPDVLKEAQKKLKSSSPKSSGKYASGWKVQTNANRTGVTGCVYNANKPGLTHLLENGHAKRGGGRVQAQEHIATVNDWAAEEIVRRIEEGLS